ncbi:MAG: DNA primase [Thermodesulfovibrionales bacterium]|nr:DNA primase [Thermodesulfovibrionales bacterium]
MKSDGILEEIKSRLDIVEIISDYVSLKKSGQNFKGICPFHSEKTPSLVVSPHKQIFHCFGCGAGGDIAGFLMKYENLSFPESLRILAKKAGVALKDYSFKDSAEKDKIKSMQGYALGFFRENLGRAKHARQYLLERGVGEESVEGFSLGYAPKGWHGLYEMLKAKGCEDGLILQSGLVSAGAKGAYDNFRDRIMFPIFDTRGEAIAFGGRVMDDSMPKYLNSPDTMLFKKGDNLYALNAAGVEIRKKGYAIVVEGYLDAIMCHQAGFKNAVAPLGTALTGGHLKKLLRYASTVILVFDGDAAGVSAAKRSLPLIMEQGMRAKVLLLPEGKDPDSLIREKDGAAAFGRLMSAAGTPIDFLLGTSKTGKTETVREALGMISAVNDRILKEELISELSDRSRIREITLREELKKLSKGPLSAPGAARRTATYSEETLLLSAIIAFPEKAGRIADAVSPEDMKSQLLRKALAGAVSGGWEVNSLINEADEEGKALIRRLSLEPGFDPAEIDVVIEDCIGKVRRRDIDRKVKTAEASGDLALLRGLIDERKRLIGGI